MSENRSAAADRSDQRPSENRSAAADRSDQRPSENRSAAADRSDSPLDRVLDVALYGPVGLAIAAKEMLPDWIAEGRRQVDNRLTLARTIGRLAVNQGPGQAEDVVRRAAGQAESVLSALGLIPRPRSTSTPGPATAGETATASATVTDAATGPMTRAPAGDAPRERPAPTDAPPAGPAPAGTDPADLAIPGYDTLSASQVVQRLPGLSPEELEAVRLHEVAGRSRKTVLLKLAQLRQGS